MKKTIKNSPGKTGVRLARNITREYAKTFYFASRFLAREKQNAAYVVYAVCRLSDDSVDNPQESQDSAGLNQIEKRIAAAYENKELNDNLLLAFQQTINKYNIPKRYFDELISGMHMDLEKNRYREFPQLYTYCYKVAGVVGLIMLRIFGYTNQEAEGHAIDLGIAMQLTNILRDIKEDYLRGRIYLPQDEMRKFGVSEEQIAKGKLNENWVNLLKFQINRTREYYQSSARGIRMINDFRSRLTASMMKDIYAGILSSIEHNDYNVFSQRARVNILGKLGITWKNLTKEKLW